MFSLTLFRLWKSWKVCSVIGTTSLFLFVKCLSPYDENESVSLKIDLQFKGPTYSGTAYTGYLPLTDWVLWIENENGSFVKTLKVNVGAVTAKTTGACEHHLPTWKTIAGISIPGTGNSTKVIPAQFDGITGASFNFSKLGKDTTISVIWDLTDEKGYAIQSGKYYYCAEVSNINKNKNDTTCQINNEFTKGIFYYENAGVTDPASPTTNILSLKANIY
jgi:hypothetical protein